MQYKIIGIADIAGIWRSRSYSTGMTQKINDYDR